MDYTSQQELYDLIKSTDNSKLWNLSGVLAKKQHKAEKAIKLAEDLKAKRGLTGLNPGAANTANADGEKKEEGLDPNLTNLTDAQLRTRVKALLVAKLDSGVLTASEIGQLKDIFNLSSSVDDLTIESINYSHALLNCPECSANLLEPPTPTIDPSASL